LVAEQGKQLTDFNLEQLDAFWDEVKSREVSGE
jgi:ATP diphosphatase